MTETIDKNPAPLNKADNHQVIIEAGKTEKQYAKDIWRYRELFLFLAWRDILVRYKQTIIGLAWSLLRPFLTMLVLVVVFHILAKLDSVGNAPYAIMVFAAMLPWQFFAASLTESSGSVIGNANMISKVYFPRLIIPVSSIIVCFVDFVISFSILILLMVFYCYVPTWRVLTLPLFILMAFALSLGIGLWISSLNVKYRDFKYIVPFLVQFGLYVSPVGYSSSVVPEKWRFLYSCNPMVGVIDGFRWALLDGGTEIYMPGFCLSIGLVILAFASGIWFFRNTEKSFADFI